MYLAKSLLLMTLFILSVPCYALKEDMREKVHIVGDSALLNYKTGVNIFEGNVKIDQGTSHVRADKVVTTNSKNHEIKIATAYGIHTLAQYWTLPKIGDTEIHANAHVITFYPQTSNVTLQKNAIVLQGDNSFRGELIYYDNNKQTVKVPHTKKGRAILVYNPDK